MQWVTLFHVELKGGPIYVKEGGIKWKTLLGTDISFDICYKGQKSGVREGSTTLRIRFQKLSTQKSEKILEMNAFGIIHAAPSFRFSACFGFDSFVTCYSIIRIKPYLVSNNDLFDEWVRLGWFILGNPSQLLHIRRGKFVSSFKIVENWKHVDRQIYSLPLLLWKLLRYAAEIWR